MEENREGEEISSITVSFTGCFAALLGETVLHYLPGLSISLGFSTPASVTIGVAILELHSYKLPDPFAVASVAGDFGSKSCLDRLTALIVFFCDLLAPVSAGSLLADCALPESLAARLPFTADSRRSIS